MWREVLVFFQYWPGLWTLQEKTWTRHLDGKNQISHRNTPWFLNYLSLKQAIWIAGACQRRNLLRRTNVWRKGFSAVLGQEEDFRGDFCCITRWISGHWHTFFSILCVVRDWTESYRMCRILYLITQLWFLSAMNMRIIQVWNYCWWKKSCTTLDGWNPTTNGINHLSTGVGFLPSTVSN